MVCSRLCCQTSTQEIERSSNKLKENLLVCLDDMCERDDEEDHSTSWTTLILRGCLKLVNSKLGIETNLRRWLHIKSAFSAMPKCELMESIHVCFDEDILFFWSILRPEWSREEECLLELIIEL